MSKKVYIRPHVTVYPLLDEITVGGLSGRLQIGDFQDNGDPNDRNEDAGW